MYRGACAPHAACARLRAPRSTPPCPHAPVATARCPWCSVRSSSASPQAAAPGWARGRMQAHPQPRRRCATDAARSSAACWVKRDALQWSRSGRGTPSSHGAKPGVCWRRLAVPADSWFGAGGFLPCTFNTPCWVTVVKLRVLEGRAGLAAEFAFRKTSKLLKRVSAASLGRSCADFDLSLCTSPKDR